MITNNSTSKAMAMMIAAMLMLPGIDAIAKWLAGSISWLGVAIIVSSGMYVFHREAELAASTN
jgi:TRAP-type mannitol/chloroaromatic compound transport system permease small subunit